MISRRVAALSLSLLAFAGCHEDPTVQPVFVQPSVEALAILSAGGTANSNSGADGLGGKGGDFRVATNGLISLGSPAFVPVIPQVPALPVITSASLATPVATLTQPGSILISGSATTAASTPIVLTSSNGDIVISGVLQSAAVGGGQADIQLVAPNGTVYITGTIRTAGVDSASDGRPGGNLLINAARVVILGTLDTHGVANTTVAGVNGGKGGDVDIRSTQGPLLYAAGSIDTSGGAAVDAAATASMRGGAGGFVHLNAPAAANSVHVFAPIRTNGGAMTGNGATPTGGAGGSVVIQGSGEIAISTTVSLLGGPATGNAIDAVGGQGGSLAVDGPAIFKLYGSLATAGGTAFATGTAGIVKGGAGGNVMLGQTAPGLNSAELGSGIFNFSGGTGSLSTGVGGGAGGAVGVESLDGDISIASSILVAGGAGTGTGNASGGAAGSLKVRTDAQASGNLSNHVLSVASLSTLLDASGGAALGSGTGGAGGTLLLQSGGDLTCGARVLTSGGTSVSGAGGSATAITPPVGALDPTSAVILLITAARIAATGNLRVTGTIETAGGIVSTGGTGANGASISMQVNAGIGSLTSLATLNTSGSSGGLGAGGNTGSLFLTSVNGDVTVSGSLTVTGSSSPVTPKAAGNVTVQSGGALNSSAIVNAVGGASTDATGVTSGQKGGTVLFDARGAFSPLTLSSGNSIVADGGSAPGTAAGTKGGAGGTISLHARGQAIDMTGLLQARGGSVSGVGTGGLGGQVFALSDFAGSGIAGNITLESGSVIDVSGGSATFLGSAQQNAGGDPGATFGGPVTLAVVFDANSSFGASGGTVVGRISNLGSIIATGSTGGDVYYNGLNATGGALLPTDNVGQNLTGTTPGHFYPH